MKNFPSNNLSNTAAYKGLERVKVRRKIIRGKKKAKKDTYEQKEGCLYESGAF